MGTEGHADAAPTMQRSGLAGLSVFVSSRAVPAENCAAAAGLGTALGSASAGWPDGIWASSVGLIDALIRTYYGIYEFSDDPKCVLPVALGQARTAVTLSDGTRVENGELIERCIFGTSTFPDTRVMDPICAGPLQYVTRCGARFVHWPSISSVSPPGAISARFAARLRCHPPRDFASAAGRRSIRI
jgi:hypothetical protein